MIKRLISLLLALVLTVGMLSPAMAFAEEEGSEEGQTSESSQEEVPEEEAADEEAADEEASEETDDTLDSVSNEESEEQDSDAVSLLSEDETQATEPPIPDALPLPELTGNQAKDVAAIAVSQIGYEETSAEATIYGKWWNGIITWNADYSKSPWCGMFAAWCSHHAGIGLGKAFNTSAAGAGYYLDFLNKNGTCDLTGETEPRIGDMVFFYDGQTASNTAHVAIVTKYDKNSKEITFVGGNQSDAVSELTVKWEINAYCSDLALYVKGIGRPNYQDKSGYLGKCEKYISYGQVTATGAAAVMSQPCDANVSAESVQVESAAAGDSYKATALFLNDQNQYWYQVAAKSNGATAYINAETVSFTHLKDGIKISVTSTPSMHIHGNIFHLEGEIESGYHGMTQVSAYVYPGNVNSGTAKTGVTDTFASPRNSYSLRGNKVDNGVSFGSLPVGSYNLVLRAFFECHYVENGTLKTVETVEERQYPFQVVSAAASTVTFDVNGGEGSNTLKTAENGSTVEAIALPSRSGYTCIGWGTSANATQAAYQPGESIPVTGNLTLYALWKENPETENPGDGCGEHVSWELKNGTLTISGTGAMEAYAHDALPWKDYSQQITKVVIGEGVTTVSIHAFRNCTNLEKVILGSTVEWSGYNEEYDSGVAYYTIGAFHGCPQLTSAGPIGSGCDIEYAWKTELPKCAFSGANYLSQVKFPSGLTTIGFAAFRGCTGLTSMEVPGSVTKIWAYGFDRCTNLEKLIIPESAVEIGNDTFLNCSKLTSAGPSGSGCDLEFGWVEAIPTMAFHGMESLEEISFLDARGQIFQRVGSSAFSGCTGLTNVVLPEGVCDIEHYAFNGCTALKSVTIPESVQSIMSNAFAGCTGLENVCFNGTEAEWDALKPYISSGNDPLLSADLTCMEVSIVASGTCGSNMTWVLDTAGVLTITGTGAIKDFKDPRDIYAFASDLAPWNRYAGQITDIALNANVTAVGDYAFSECSELKTVTIPLSMKNVGKYAFRSSKNLTDIYYAGTDAEWATVKSRAETGNTPLFKESVTLHTNWGNRVNTKSGTCGDDVIWILNLDTGKMTISGTGEMYDYWGGHGDYQPESRYTPWNDVYMQIKSVVIEPGVTKIGMYTFANCRLTEVTIPETVTSINHHAFKDNLKLTDVYYGGSEADWNALKAKVGANNGYLLDAPNKHFADEESVELESVRYYHSWEKSTNTIFFGADAEKSCLITEETDVSSISELYLGRYVLVKTKMVGSQEILLNMVLPKTAVGTVTTVANGKIVIDEDSYTLPSDMPDPQKYLNKKVVYQIAYNNLAGIEVLQEKEGYLTHWHSEGRQLRIQTNAESSDYKFYHLSSLAPEDNEYFLGICINSSGKTDVVVHYLVDSNRIVYQITPDFERRENGFSESEHGWPIVNTAFCYGYDENETYRHDRDLYFVYGSSIESLTQAWVPYFGRVYGGNCFGLSMLAVAHYAEKIDLKQFFDHAGTKLNEFGYDSVQEWNDGQVFTLFHYEQLGDYQAKFSKRELVEKIELAQISQYSPDVTDHEQDLMWASDIVALVEYLNGYDPSPLLLNMSNVLGAGHTVVIETAVKPVYIGNGAYAIPLYDSNAPEYPDNYPDAESLHWTYHQQQSWLYVNAERSTIGYFCGGEYKDKYTVFSYINIDDLDLSYFDNYQLGYLDGKMTFHIESFDDFSVLMVESETGDQTKVFDFVDDVPKVYIEGGEYTPYWQETLESTTDDMTMGTLVLPEGNYIIQTKNRAYIECMYRDHVFAFSGNGEAELQVDYAEDEISVSASDEALEAVCAYGNSKVDYASSAEVSLTENAYFTLSVCPEEAESAVETNVSSDAVTMTHAVDGELIDVTPDMIHQHKDLAYKAAAEADCTHPGNVAHYVCSCGKTFVDENACEPIENVVIPARGHTGEWVPTENEGEESRICERCGERETRNIGNRLVMDPAVFGDHTSVWIEGVEYPVMNQNGQLAVLLPEGDSFHMTTYTFHVGDAADIHTQYPLTMQVWKITKGEDGKYTAANIPELDNILQYSGSSIRITGNKGIRMITSITQENKSALTSQNGLGGYTLLEYGTALCFARELEGGKPLTLGQEYTRSNYAYKKGVADPVFAYSGNLMQYTNVLVGFTNDQCKEDIAMRPYMILEDAEGEQVTVYGGTVYRSIGYIAWQNRLVFSPGTGAYNFVWDIIHHVYGDRYDEDYKK